MAASFPGSNPGDTGYWEVVFDVIPFPVYVADIATLRIICANRAMRQKCGAQPGDICHAVIYGLDQPCSFCKVAALEEAAVQGENSLVFEHFNDQDDSWAQLRETLVTWIDGRRSKYSVAVDISALKEVQNALAEAHAELSIKNRGLNALLEREREVMRGQRNFLAMVSHEFRMPLAIIDGAAQVIDHYVVDRPEAGEEVAKIQRAARRMTDLIEICMADDRLETALTALQPTRLDLAAVVEDVVADKLPLAGAARLILRVAERPVIRGDLSLLRVAVSNLIDNALKYSPTSEPVEIALELLDGDLAITVADRGAGIAEDEQDRIFEKFFRSTRADGVRGAGLGLFIVKRVVDLHQGRVSVASRPDGGSVFAISLPVEVEKTT